MSNPQGASLNAPPPDMARTTVATMVRRPSPSPEVVTEVPSAPRAPVNDFTEIRGPATRTVHSIDYRVSLPTVFFGSWYVVLLAGPERRNRERLKNEGQTSLSRRFVAVTTALLAVLFFAGIGLLTLAYLLKSALKINIFSTPSFLHPIYKLFW